jgi:mono/diheme cytochrome c family protein
MRRILLLLSVILLIGFSASFAQQNSKPTAEAAPAQIPAEASAKVNPVKPTLEGLADAKKLYGYHCSMCHGKDGDGKGDLAEQMKLTLHDWRDASSISKMTDGDLFYIITNGRGKMVGGEGDRRKETLRWELVNYVRLFGNKGTEAATSK